MSVQTPVCREPIAATGSGACWLTASLLAHTHTLQATAVPTLLEYGPGWVGSEAGGVGAELVTGGPKNKGPPRLRLTAPVGCAAACRERGGAQLLVSVLWYY